MSDEVIWWEKTVEYKFIVDAHKERSLDFAAPLSGIQEMAGDGVFSADAKLILVEFKRDFNSLKNWILEKKSTFGGKKKRNRKQNTKKKLNKKRMRKNKLNKYRRKTSKR